MDENHTDPRIGEYYIIARQRKRGQLTCVISVIAENKPLDHHETHLHKMKVVMILIPSFYCLR